MAHVAFAVVLLMNPIATSASETVLWEQLREAVGECICMLARTFEGRTGYSPVVGDRSRCGAPPVDTPLVRAVDAAFPPYGRSSSSLT
jgi:hypothetical protein